LAHNYIVLNHSYEVDPVSGVHRLRLNPLQTVYPTHSLSQINCELNTSQPNGTGIEMSGITRIFLGTTMFDSLKAALDSGATVGVSYECAHSPPYCYTFGFGT
jgi:hypothetical protein